MKKRNKMNECWTCKNMHLIPGSTHIGCKTPDPDMTGDEHGIKNGWFAYPYYFEPLWKTKDCVNYKTIKG